MSPTSSVEPLRVISSSTDAELLANGARRLQSRRQSAPCLESRRLRNHGSLSSLRPTSISSVTASIRSLRLSARSLSHRPHSHPQTIERFLCSAKLPGPPNQTALRLHHWADTVGFDQRHSSRACRLEQPRSPPSLAFGSLKHLCNQTASRATPEPMGSFEIDDGGFNYTQQRVKITRRQRTDSPHFDW